MTNKEFEAIIMACGINMESEVRKEPITMYDIEALKRFQVVCEIANAVSDGKAVARVDPMFGDGIVSFEEWATEINQNSLKQLANNADCVEIEVTDTGKARILFEVNGVRKKVGYANPNAN